MKYNPQKIEKKWQKRWKDSNLYQAKDKSKKPKKYLVVEFPYPSGDGLHVGHVRSYTALDVLARKKRMEGYNVLYPMGWDAFGLPTENYALATGIHPIKITEKNIRIFKRQMNSLGLSFDWSREINTTDPSYYKWTQWIFLQFFKKDLAYQREMPINWCPKCKIGLANEEAIGGSEGTSIKFKIQNSKQYIEIFTTRADTLFGVTALVLAPEHPFVASLLKIKNQKSKIKNYEEIKKYIKNSKKKSEFERTQLEKEKTGVFIGAYCLNPANNEKVPIWVGDYVISTYGDGAVMVVPAHDKRDYQFAKKYNLKIKEAIKGGYISKEAYVDYGVLINSGRFNGLKSEQAIKKITDWLI